MNEGSGRYTDHLVIGAGMCGLSAASALKAGGHSVLVLDKGRGVGGRMATRRIGGATFDHGAQFVTARTERFARWIRDACSLGVAGEWCRGFAPSKDGHPRWRAGAGMSALARYLAVGLDVELERQVAALRLHEMGWVARMQDGRELRAGSIILTAPVPQAVSLLDAGGVAVEAALRTRLDAVGYEQCFAVMAVLDGPSMVPVPGAVAPGSGPLAWIADNQQKGISADAALTLHATDAYSKKNWERNRDEVAKELLAAAEPWIGANVIHYQIHGWRYSRPSETDFAPCLVLKRDPPLILAGDGFGGGRVEGAALSGWAAAEELLRILGERG